MVSNESNVGEVIIDLKKESAFGFVTELNVFTRPAFIFFFSSGDRMGPNS